MGIIFTSELKRFPLFMLSVARAVGFLVPLKRGSEPDLRNYSEPDLRNHETFLTAQMGQLTLLWHETCKHSWRNSLSSIALD